MDKHNSQQKNKNKNSKKPSAQAAIPAYLEPSPVKAETPPPAAKGANASSAKRK